MHHADLNVAVISPLGVLVYTGNVERIPTVCGEGLTLVQGQVRDVVLFKIDWRGSLGWR